MLTGLVELVIGSKSVTKLIYIERTSDVLNVIVTESWRASMFQALSNTLSHCWMLLLKAIINLIWFSMPYFMDDLCCQTTAFTGTMLDHTATDYPVLSFVLPTCGLATLAAILMTAVSRAPRCETILIQVVPNLRGEHTWPQCYSA